jgi:hypothetical protein
MKLTLEEIWKMADLLEEAQKVSIKSKSDLQEKVETKERVLKLPKLQISENWGKENTLERGELERIVESATKGGNTPFERLTMIKKQMDEIASGADVKNPRRILSQIMLLETLNRLFKSFQPSPAGFINEAFLSVLYGSTQKDALKANAEGDIGDITDGDIPVSLKTLTSAAAHVKGSVANLITSINKSGKVYFDLYLKDSSGAKSPVGQLRVIRFVVDSSNINQFLQLAPNTINFDATTGQLELPQKPIKEGFVLSEEDPVVPGLDDDLTPEAQQLFKSLTTNRKGQPLTIKSESAKGEIAFNVLKANNFEMPKAGDFTLFVNNLDDRALATLSTLLQNEPESEKLDRLIRDIAGTEIQKTKASKKGLKTDFEIPQSHWSKFARQYGQKQIVLEFSDEKIQQIIQSAVNSLDQSITDIFNNLADFTSSLQSYLTSTARNRGKDGEKAMQLAAGLPKQTSKIIKTGAVEG